MWKSLGLVLLTAAGVLVPAEWAHSKPAPGSGSTAYDEFQAKFGAGQYAAALPHAQRMVAEAAAAAVGDQDLLVALNVLAVTQLRLGDFAGAEASFLRSLDLLRRSHGISSERFVEPFAGLAAIAEARGDHTQAIEFRRQALAVGRRANGLFNSGQAALVEALAASYMTIGDYPAAEMEQRYLVLIAERQHGADDPRVVPALSRLASWYESMENYLSARLVYARIYRIARRERGTYNPLMIDALLAIGRTHRLQFASDPESLTRPYSTLDQVSQVWTPGRYWLRQREFDGAKPDRTGKKALQRALGALEKQDDPPAQLLARTLIELGDWYMAVRQYSAAMQNYSRAAEIIAVDPDGGQAGPLNSPRVVAYRPPPAAIEHRWLPPAKIIPRSVRFMLTVTEKGETRDVVLRDTDMSSMQAFQLQQALDAAIFRPRFESSRPVETTGVEFTGQWFDLSGRATPDPEYPLPAN